MAKDDAQLIHRILSGDNTAFTTLVEKYYRSVHALAWRKIDDFHHAEEITQDTFLQAYKKLSTLRNPDQFAGWLYVIADRLCIGWLRKQKPAMRSLEDTRTDIVEKLSYKNYISEQRETEASEHHYEIIKNLLEKLPEHERTVMTLHYLDEMTTKEIGTFLNVPVKTVHSRLHRARKRLQGEAFPMTQEGSGELKQAAEELSLKKFVPKMLDTIEKKVHAELQAQLGKSIPDTQMGRDLLKQVSEKMMSDIKKKILAQLQAQFGEGFLKK
ncbi:hypothetical protein C6499_00020 [Candidatus Poribacteria bacterium]|nr:MAG: hypothetical protein C6499_00020 [Candidatus Poribacteria bacterium]